MFCFKKWLNTKTIYVIHINEAISENSSSAFKKDNMFNTVMKQLEEVYENNADGLLLRINCPGGAAAASEEIAKMVEKIKQQTYVVTSIGDICASGAYLIAAMSDKIFANQMSLIGNIGVIMQIPNITSLSKKIGITNYTIKSGKMKDIGNMFREMTTEEEQYLHNLVIMSHNTFVMYVKAHRQIDESLADGRIFDAHTALDNGLIDKYGTKDDALRYLKEHLSNEDNFKIIELKPKRSFLSNLVNVKVSLTDGLNFLK